MSPFELFDRGSHVNHMSVNIQYGTRITFSKLCLEHLNCEKVLYLYDQSANLAAIMPCDAANRNGYTLHKNEAQAYVSARTFIQFIKAPDGKRDAKWIDGKIQFPIVIEEQP